MEIKKRLSIFLILFFCVSVNIFSLNITKTPLVNPFPSQENLNNFTKTTSLDGYDLSELDDTKISLITITPGKEIYSWFGHSAILIEQKDKKAIVYDYGVFSFNSDNFYEHFLEGKMYYLLIPSYADSRLQVAIDEDRTVSKVELNIPNEKKIDIINFLNYNSQSDNNTYLYDFYTDNCATRIRDIFNWATDNEFKQWAQNQYTPFSFRDLSIKQLDNSLFVNWVLNSFLGPSCDVKNSAWENMFSPEFLEKSIMEYEGFNANKTIIYSSNTSTSFNEFRRTKHHLLFYSAIGLLLGLIGLLLKTFKQDNELALYGIFNSIILLFLLIISLFIFYFVFFSNIQPTYNNENIFFFNPIIYLILFISSLTTISSKKDSTFRLFVFEKLISLYSLYLIVFIVVKNILTTNLYQQNYTIILPLFLFFSIQGILLTTKR